MKIRRLWIPLILCVFLLAACDYIVLPEDDTPAASVASKGWSAQVINLTKTDAGGVKIELALHNETANWSAMQAAAKPAVLVSDGKNTNCETVFVSTGGHYLAPGFMMRGLMTGTKAEPKMQLISVECPAVKVSAGAKLAIEYSYVTGDYNYYEKEGGKVNDKMEVSLDKVAKDLKYPSPTPYADMLKPDFKVTALNECTLTLGEVKRSEKGLQMKWLNANPGEYPTYVHIGQPPVIGSDGLIYGLYESPDIASVPVTGPGKTADWTTEVAVPKDVQGLVVLMSVENKQQRLFTHYALELSGQ